MLSRRASSFAPCVPLVVAAAWLAWRWDALPDSIDLGFGKVAGTRTPKVEFARHLLLSVGFLGVVSSAAAIVLPCWRAWDAAHVPDRAYWLSPERRASTIARTVTLLGLLGAGFASVIALAFVRAGEAAIAGSSVPLRSTISTILLAVVSLPIWAWYYRPFLVRWNEQRRATR